MTEEKVHTSKIIRMESDDELKLIEDVPSAETQWRSPPSSAKWPLIISALSFFPALCGAADMESQYHRLIYFPIMCIPFWTGLVYKAKVVYSTAEMPDVFTSTIKLAVLQFSLPCVALAVGYGGTMGTIIPYCYVLASAYFLQSLWFFIQYNLHFPVDPLYKELDHDILTLGSSLLGVCCENKCCSVAQEYTGLSQQVPPLALMAIVVVIGGVRQAAEAPYHLLYYLPYVILNFVRAGKLSQNRSPTRSKVAYVYQMVSCLWVEVFILVSVFFLGSVIVPLQPSLHLIAVLACNGTIMLLWFISSELRLKREAEAAARTMAATASAFSEDKEDNASSETSSELVSENGEVVNKEDLLLEIEDELGKK